MEGPSIVIAVEELKPFIGKKIGLVTHVVARAQLDQAALSAVRQWLFTPTSLNGQAVDVEMTVTVTFEKDK